MAAERTAAPAGWLVLSALLLLSPLVQGAAPRLPFLAIELGILGLAVAWVVSWARAPRRELRLGAFDALVAVLLFWSLFSTLFAPYYHAAEAAFVAIACYAALYWYLSVHPSYAGLRAVFVAARAQAALQSLLVLWEGFGAGRSRPPGTFYNPNFLAGFLAAVLVWVLADLLFAEPGGAPRPARRVALQSAEILLAAAALLTTGSRGGVLALAAGLLVVLGVRSWKATASLFAAAVAALVLIPNPLLVRLQGLSQDPFAYTRLAIWKTAFSMMLDHPWVGIGLGQFEFVSTRYAFPVTTHWAKYTRVAENAHCEYLQAGAELGVAGLLLTVGGLALLVGAAARRLRALPPQSRGPVLGLLAGAVAVAAQAAVDFPLHGPPAALLFVVFAAGLRLHGVTSGERAVGFRVRPLYAGAAACVALLLGAMALRPVAGFWLFLGGIGAPQDLLREKWSLEEAPRRQLPPEEAARRLRQAVRVDAVNAPYRRAYGSALFQAFLRGEAGDEARHEALYQLAYAAELNPNQFQYQANLGQAMTSLARLRPPGRDLLTLALEHYRRATQLAPFQYPVWVELGVVAEELGDLKAAEGAFRRAVAIEEYYLHGWFNLGTFLARQQRYDEALAALRRGAELATRGQALEPTNEAERALLAVEPDVFYNQMRRIEREQRRKESPTS